MKRRKFLQTSALGIISSTCFSQTDLTNSLTPYIRNHTKPEMQGFVEGIDPIVPFLYFPEKEEFMLKQLIEIKEKYGLRRFVFIGPYPQQAEDYDITAYKLLGEQIRHVKEKLASHQIDIGWWGVGLRYGAALKHDFQRIVNINGNTAMRSYCPLDKNFQQFMSSNITTLIKECDPFVVQFDDDYELSWQPPGKNDFGCFCPLHLKKFGERIGHYYTREELVSIFSKVTPESKRLRRAWAEVSRDSLVELATEVRKEVDKISPKTRLSLCQAGCSDFDGNFTQAVTQAFAGKNKPMVRLFGTEYSSNQDMFIPETLFSALYHRQHLPKEFECFYEADTAPHIRYYMSATKLKTLITIALSYGLEDLLLYAAQYNSTPLEERGYFEMYVNERKRFAALKKAVRNCETIGCEIIHNPFSHIAAPYKEGGWYGPRRSDWIHVLGRMGIAYTTKGGKVKMLSNIISDSLKDDEIKELLSGCLVLDGQAANTLVKSGWGKQIGLEDIKTTDTSTEVGFGTERTQRYTLVPSDKAIVFDKLSDLSVLGAINNVTIGISTSPDLVLFENEYGGKVAVLALSLEGNLSSQVFNYKRQEHLRQIIEWVGGEKLPIFVKKQPNVFCIFNREQTGKYGIATIISLCSDTFHTFDLDLSSEWSERTTIELLNQEGEWSKVDFSKSPTGITARTELHYLSPVIIRFTKQ